MTVNVSHLLQFLIAIGKVVGTCIIIAIGLLMSIFVILGLTGMIKQMWEIL